MKALVIEAQIVSHATWLDLHVHSFYSFTSFHSFMANTRLRWNFRFCCYIPSSMYSYASIHCSQYFCAYLWSHLWIMCLLTILSLHSFTIYGYIYIYHSTHKWDLILSQIVMMMMMMRKEGIWEKYRVKERANSEYSMWKNLHAWKFVCMLPAHPQKNGKMISFLSHFLFSSTATFCYVWIFSHSFILPLILFENCLHGYNLSLSCIINQDIEKSKEIREHKNYI